MKGTSDALSEEILEYILSRGFPMTLKARRSLRAIVLRAHRVPTVTEIAHSTGVSRRALTRWFREAGLPPPSRWLQVVRHLHAIAALETPGVSICRVAWTLRYPDGFALSDQMLTLVGVRPSAVRGEIAWTEYFDMWVARESQAGRFSR